MVTNHILTMMYFLWNILSREKVCLSTSAVSVKHFNWLSHHLFVSCMCRSFQAFLFVPLSSGFFLFSTFWGKQFKSSLKWNVDMDTISYFPGCLHSFESLLWCFYAHLGGTSRKKLDEYKEVALRAKFCVKEGIQWDHLGVYRIRGNGRNLSN